jgi:putative transposase
MSRALRIEYPGAYYHVTARGNERKAIFRAAENYEKFIGYLESATERYGAQIHCFCLMPNHYHLLLETPRGNLHTILHHLNTSYTNYFNAKARRAGHLLQGRYHAILVEKDRYALELSRYIHLNPVRARLVREPSGYGWSSYCVYVGIRKGWEWLEKGYILNQISSRERRAQRGYKKYVEEGMRQKMGDPLEKGVGLTVLGSERFMEWVRLRWIKKKDIRRDVPALRRLARWPDLSTILKETEKVFGRGTAETRRVGLYLSHRFSGVRLSEIGKFFGGIGPSAVTQNTRRLEVYLGEDRGLSKRVDRLKETLSE